AAQGQNSLTDVPNGGESALVAVAVGHSVHPPPAVVQFLRLRVLEEEAPLVGKRRLQRPERQRPLRPYGHLNLIGGLSVELGHGAATEDFLQVPVGGGGEVADARPVQAL